MKNPGLHLAALRSFTKRKEPGLQGWQVTLPEETGTVHCVRRDWRIGNIETPIFLEDPPAYGHALCGAQVKVILPTAFANAGDDECPRCEEQLRVDEFDAAQRRLRGLPGYGFEGVRPGKSTLVSPRPIG